MPEPQISVLICTYNGESSLEPLLRSFLEQSVPVDLASEMILVDNNSRDGTVALAARLARENPGRITVLRESQQGKSYALNRGLQSVRGEICCVIDQDQLLPVDYLATVWKAFQREPSVHFMGGRVLPLPEQRLTDWITPHHWPALAICDYGTKAFRVDSERFVCLLAGAFRSASLREAGYTELLGIRPGRLGSVEDADLYERLVTQGKAGRYIPEILVYHRLGEERFDKEYHRRWHFGHGKYFSDMRSPHFEVRRFSVGRPLPRDAECFPGSQEDATAIHERIERAGVCSRTALAIFPGIYGAALEIAKVIVRLGADAGVNSTSKRVFFESVRIGLRNE